MSSVQESMSLNTIPPVVVEDKSGRYQIIRSKDPEEELTEGLWKKRPLKALAGIVGAVAAPILAVCFYIVLNIFTGGMGGGLLPGAAYLMGTSKGMSLWQFTVNIWGRIILSGAVGGGLAWGCSKINDKANEFSHEKEVILSLAIRIKNDPSIFDAEISRLQEKKQLMKADIRSKVEEYFTPPVFTDDMLKAQYLLQLRSLVKEAELLSQTINQKTETRTYPVGYDAYGNPKEWKSQQIILSQTPSVAELESAKTQLEKAIDALQIIRAG